MSDEIHIESAMRHVDQAALHQWQAHLADEEVMDREDGGLAVPESASWLLEAAMVYMFACNDVMNWENVGVRAFRLIRTVCPRRLTRRDRDEADGLLRGVKIGSGFGNPKVQKLCEVDENRDFLEKVLVDFMYPERRRRLFKGTQTAYVLAWAYMPQMVNKTVEKKLNGGITKWVQERLTFEDMAEIFYGFDKGSFAPGPERIKARNKVRSRLSAMAKTVLRRRIEDAGGKVGRECGKSASARQAMARSAMGNGNRKGN